MSLLIRSHVRPDLCCAASGCGARAWLPGVGTPRGSTVGRHGVVVVEARHHLLQPFSLFGMG